ncbi:hypothetical protein B0H13DRAFT_2380641 [Mycena leptocephala]|nr:hypothetical protein B0H13DRAFT_2380641 [Mycena leptocephala]
MLGQCKSSKLVSGQVGQLEGPPTSKYNKSSQDATAPAGGQIFSVHKQIHVAVAFNDDVRSGQPRAACGHTLNSAGTTDTLVTDSSWCVYTGLPAGYEQPSFEDTTWAVAKNIGTYRFFDPGDAVVTLSCPPCPPAIALYYAGWIWTDVVPSSGKVPAGSILITADDDYTLYINGVPIGSGSNWQVAQHYTVNFGAGTTEVVFAVLATNVAPSAATTAGLIVAAEINMVPTGRTNCTAGSSLVSDALRKSTRHRLKYSCLSLLFFALFGYLRESYKMRGIEGLQPQGTAAQVGLQRWASWCPKLPSSPRREPQTVSLRIIPV